MAPSRTFSLALFSALLAVALPCAATSGGPPAPPATRDSVSVGTPMSGSLARGEVLPVEGSGYRLMQTTRERKARFGVAELVRLVKQSAHEVRRRIPGSLLMVADLSPRKGGRAEHHGSHQNGRDVDFAFYITDRGGAPVATEVFVPFDTNGCSVDPPLQYRFDTARNWALVRALLESEAAQVQWIFVADHLRALLLDHGAASKAPGPVLARARQVLRQPGRKGHWDHFHVRIYCPAGDLPRCRDVGPRRAWTR